MFFTTRGSALYSSAWYIVLLRDTWYIYLGAYAIAMLHTGILVTYVNPDLSRPSSQAGLALFGSVDGFIHRFLRIVTRRERVIASRCNTQDYKVRRGDVFTGRGVQTERERHRLRRTGYIVGLLRARMIPLGRVPGGAGPAGRWSCRVSVLSRHVLWRRRWVTSWGVTYGEAGPIGSAGHYTDNYRWQGWPSSNLKN
jgi:hypothetical protein